MHEVRLPLCQRLGEMNECLHDVWRLGVGHRYTTFGFATRVPTRVSSLYDMCSTLQVPGERISDKHEGVLVCAPPALRQSATDAL
jgi:hypothetical protein